MEDSFPLLIDPEDILGLALTTFFPVATAGYNFRAEASGDSKPEALPAFFALLAIPFFVAV